jgi:uncharacterized repeat protein (TIGR03837 family)
MNTSRLRHWDIFCRVIDNYGDIGVSWRLARQLAAEYGVQVRLWVDQMASLKALCPRVDVEVSRQTVDGVTVFKMTDESEWAQPAEVVIEAFGCRLPPAYVQAMNAMAARGHKPLWIVLEYLSAEPWVREHHGLPSPHPQFDLPRYFFFPGFSEGTGGVLREADLLARRDRFDTPARREFWARLGFDEPPREATVLSLFAYPRAPYRALLEACADGASPVIVAIPAGLLTDGAREHLRCGESASARQGNLEVRFVPFVPQADYDALLWACDVNFVRGEDSFVRAQWAGRPWVWHIYPQAEDAHRVKLDAFLDIYAAHRAAPAVKEMRDLWHVWNGVTGAPSMADAWRAYAGALPVQRQGAWQWQTSLARVGDLAGNLVKFCQKMI